MTLRCALMRALMAARNNSAYFCPNYLPTPPYRSPSSTIARQAALQLPLFQTNPIPNQYQPNNQPTILYTMANNINSTSRPQATLRPAATQAYIPPSDAPVYRIHAFHSRCNEKFAAVLNQSVLDVSFDDLREETRQKLIKRSIKELTQALQAMRAHRQQKAESNSDARWAELDKERAHRDKVGWIQSFPDKVERQQLEELEQQLSQLRFDGESKGHQGKKRRLCSDDASNDFVHEFHALSNKRFAAVLQHSFDEVKYDLPEDDLYEADRQECIIQAVLKLKDKLKTLETRPLHYITLRRRTKKKDFRKKQLKKENQGDDQLENHPFIQLKA
ncbi:uncharacterized protein BDZ99DRAFT_469479 [Mytilinidion resinicola]|uniref:Uncharacterized protein n=1 Tax=Mytilinidion resinicola TaxID=574789 RepID=A0A6A6XYV3_9PEZI|nr:uncharacterized protein BDZ99DRAFT_469479 [Mytilinidion resinicola]KAF2801746.1 hypothetical protein BDZ99DRAFT_469479 [Mytilinidion resinicola]